MKQVFQDVSQGQSLIIDVPRPSSKPGHLIIRSTQSLISAGTERMLVDFGRASYIDKARQQPDKVRMVLNKIQTDGLLPTVEAVRAKLDQPLPMGYSNVGIVEDIGCNVTGFKVGDRVVSNGHHAEMVRVPQNLCARIPDGVDDQDAAFTIVGAIALQGIRLAKPAIGEYFVVVGLGLIGLLTVQILRAHGCRVLGIDIDPEKLSLAAEFGAETCSPTEHQDPLDIAQSFSRGRGVDGVIITASTKSNEPIQQAAKMCRKRGQIILVGVVGLDIQRSDFYEKEITFQVSCSYGPGRYDPTYEEQGHDYPIGFVRWTEQRNFEAILDLLAARKIDTKLLKTASYDILEAGKAYDALTKDRSVLGILLRYPLSVTDTGKTARSLKLADPPLPKSSDGRAIIGAIGAGNYAGRILLPAFQSSGARLKTISCSQGISSTHIGKKLGFEISSTQTEELLNDDEINSVVIATQHDSHAHLVVNALKKGKNVFVEKPLALTYKEIDTIDTAYVNAWDRGDNPRLMVGFNRRFAPLAQKLHLEISRTNAPISLIYTCNAGQIPADSWIHNPTVGGGRIIGEACHFIDFARHLAGAPIENINSSYMVDKNQAVDCHDTASITLTFENGSLATILYLANGHRSFPKERIDVFQRGNTWTLNNFRSLKGYGVTTIGGRSRTQNKGQAECCLAFIESVRGNEPTPIPYDQLIEVAKATIEAAQSLESTN